MGIDLISGGKSKRTKMTAPRSDDIYLKLIVKGPDFAILGAWFICQLLNQDALSKDNSESMIQKAIIATALSCILSNFGPIDDCDSTSKAYYMQ